MTTTRILVVSGESLPGFERRCLPVAAELKQRGFEVMWTGPARAMYGKEHFRLTTYADDFPADPEAAAVGARLFSSWSELEEMILWCDVLLVSTSKGYKPMVDFARARGRLTIQHRDKGGNDEEKFFFDAHFTAIGGRFEEQRLRRLGGDPENMEIVGRLQYDGASPDRMRLTREAFCAKYGLDPAQKTVVFLPSSPAGHAPGVKRLFQETCRRIGETPGFQLIIKPHPREYDGAKQETCYEDLETPTWEQVMPGIPACLPEDVYDCYRHAEVGVTQVSTTFHEFALFGKPFLFVEMGEFHMARYGFDPEWLRRRPDREKFQGAGRRPWRAAGMTREQIEAMPDPAMRETMLGLAESYWGQFEAGGQVEYVGGECTLEELKGILERGEYRIDDPALFKEIAAEYAHANDGCAWLRLADLTARVIGSPAHRGLLARIRFIRPWQRLKRRIFG